MAEPQLAQGQVWIADLPAPIHRRPVLILTRSSAASKLRGITVATISTKIRGVETEVLLTSTDGVAQRCAVSLDNVFTIRREYLDRFVVNLPTERMNEVFEAIHAAFELPY